MEDPIPTFTHLVSRLPNLAYLHVIEPRIAGSAEYTGPNSHDTTVESNDFLRKIWAPKPMISAGGFNRETGIDTAERTGNLIAYGRLFISNVSSWSSPFLIDLGLLILINTVFVARSPTSPDGKYPAHGEQSQDLLSSRKPYALGVYRLSFRRRKREARFRQSFVIPIIWAWPVIPAQ